MHEGLHAWEWDGLLRWEGIPILIEGNMMSGSVGVEEWVEDLQRVHCTDGLITGTKGHWVPCPSIFGKHDQPVDGNVLNQLIHLGSKEVEDLFRT